MTETYTPAVRVVVVASLLLAIAAMTFVTARVSFAGDACPTKVACEGDACEMVVSKRSCAAYAVDFTMPATPVAWVGLIGPAPRRMPG
jgi:hypothetical protein